MYDPFMRLLSGLLMALCLVSAQAESASESSSIGKADLNEARRLLSEAHNELEPQQWALLDSKLVEAERAWDGL